MAGSACRFDPAYRDYVPDAGPACAQGATRCAGAVLQTCSTSATWNTTTDCSASGEVCSTALGACATCDPGAMQCQGQDIVACDSAGQTWVPSSTCDPGKGFACRQGACQQLCQQASAEQSNVGCEYWGADL
ncbi:MAG TPA: hypothetical protein VIY73_16555, partial [Polyangiaceae bacterium]